MASRLILQVHRGHVLSQHGNVVTPSQAACRYLHDSGAASATALSLRYSTASGATTSTTPYRNAPSLRKTASSGSVASAGQLAPHAAHLRFGNGSTAGW